MRSDLKRIYKSFNGKLIGNVHMKKCVCETVAHMTPKIIAYITNQCWFISSMEDAWAFTFTGNDLKNQHLIFLSDELLTQHSPQIYYSIAHEIGHVMLGHRNSVLKRQTKREIKKQETAADAFAKQFITK